jgi:hypothetical protein
VSFSACFFNALAIISSSVFLSIFASAFAITASAADFLAAFSALACASAVRVAFASAILFSAMILP